MNDKDDFLYHFTKDYDTLIKILKNGFRLSLCTEERKGLPDKLNNNRTRAPLLCFTDIKLHEIKLHTKKYGQFGIAMSKEWAETYKAQPVIYMNKNTGFSEAIKQFLPHVQEQYFDKNRTHKSLEEMFLFNLQLLSKDLEDFNEKEWRILPQFANEKLKEYDKNVYADILSSDNIILIVVPKKYIRKLKEDIEIIFKKKFSDTYFEFPIMPYEYIEKI